MPELRTVRQSLTYDAGAELCAYIADGDLVVTVDGKDPEVLAHGVGSCAIAGCAAGALLVWVDALSQALYGRARVGGKWGVSLPIAEAAGPIPSVDAWPTSAGLAGAVAYHGAADRGSADLEPFGVAAIDYNLGCWCEPERLDEAYPTGKGRYPSIKGDGRGALLCAWRDDDMSQPEPVLRFADSAGTFDPWECIRAPFTGADPSLGWGPAGPFLGYQRSLRVWALGMSPDPVAVSPGPHRRLGDSSLFAAVAASPDGRILIASSTWERDDSGRIDVRRDDLRTVSTDLYEPAESAPWTAPEVTDELHQTQPSVAVRPDGGFRVAWTDHYQAIRRADVG